LIVLPRLPRLHEVLVGPYPIPPRWPYWTYLTNYLRRRARVRAGLLDVAWSLRSKSSSTWCGRGRVPVSAEAVVDVCAAIIVAEPIARNLALEPRRRHHGGLRADVVPSRRIGHGRALAWLSGVTGCRDDRHGRRPWRSPACRIVMVVINAGDSWWWQPAMQRLGYSLIAITGGAMLVRRSIRREALWPRMLSAGWLRAFGKYSYCLYLIHLPVMRAFREYVFDPGDYAMLAPWVGQLLFYVAATAPTFGLAWLSWRVFEAPILSLKAKFPY
jgi:hypothetical protein